MRHRTYPARQRRSLPRDDLSPTTIGSNLDPPTPLSDVAGRSPSIDIRRGITGRLSVGNFELELGWGTSQPNAPRPQYVFTPYRKAQLRSKEFEVDVDGPISPVYSCTRNLIQSLLPNIDRIWLLVEYHEHYLLWYHCCYHGPTFRAELEGVIGEQDDKTTLDISELHPQWMALLFSIMAGSLTCATQSRLQDWGFSKLETSTLSKQWFKAAVTCLNLGDWTTNHDIYAVSAVATLNMSAHALGESGQLSVLLAAAVKIAQSLGLDRLEYDPAREDIDENSPDEMRHYALHQDLGRKIWSQLCIQDWMSIPFSGNHIISPSHFTTSRPFSRHYLSMEFVPETFPTYISYMNYVFEIGRLVARHHESTLQSTTPFTKYQQVLEYDRKMKELATKDMPRYFHVIAPMDSAWPLWVRWARSSLTICFSHEIIMIHRDYISESFTNPAYSATRVTCVAAAKTILSQLKQALDASGPLIWVDVSFLIVASLILCLDVHHRSTSEPERTIHETLIRDCAEKLQLLDNSVVAERGAALLREMLGDHNDPSYLRNGTEEERLGSSILSKIKNDLSTELFPPATGLSTRFMRQQLLVHKLWER